MSTTRNYRTAFTTLALRRHAEGRRKRLPSLSDACCDELDAGFPPDPVEDFAKTFQFSVWHKSVVSRDAARFAVDLDIDVDFVQQ